MSASVNAVLGGLKHIRNRAVRMVLGSLFALCALTLAAAPAMAQTITGATISPSTYSGTGQTITLTVTVNSGNKVASSATVTSQIGAVYSCPIADTVNTGVTFTCTANYATTATDVSNLQIQEQPVVRLLSFATPTIMTYGGILQASYVVPASPPTVTGVLPSAGPTAGGTSVVITGTNFTGATAVNFGATPASSFTVNNASQITATSPAGTGTVDVRVTTGAGTSTTSAADRFSYIAAPAIGAIAPNTGPAAGGTSVTVSGTNFTGATGVSFGATPATGFTVNSATQITATAPAGTGTVDVRITTSGGTSATSAADQFTFISTVAPAITANPSNQTVNAGSTATFTAAASGTPTPTVQWQVDSGSGFINIGGATSTTLSFSAAGSQNGNLFRAVFTNSAGSVNTTAATLTVNTLPSVTTNPLSQTVTIGGTATFTAAASGSPTPTVQWQVDSGSGYGNIAGATSTTLSFTVTAADNNSAYRAIFTNPAGGVSTAGATLTVSKATQAITVTSPAPASAAVGGASYTPGATANSGLAVVITIDPSAGSVCTIAGGTVSFQNVGSCVITFNQAGDSTYQAAPQVQQSFAVGQGGNVITFPPLADTPFTSTPPSPAAAASSGLTVSYASTTTGVCTVSGAGAISFASAGTCSITASQAGNANYAAATPVSRSFQVTPGVNTITFAALPSRALGSGTFNLAATASSGLTVAYVSTTTEVCTVSGTTVSLLAVGNCSITANQSGNSNFAAAAPVSQTFAITKAASSVALTSSAPSVFFGQPVTLTATVTGIAPTGTVTFSDGGATLGSVALTGSTASFTTSTLSAGSHSFTATYNGDGSNNASNSAAVSVAVTQRPDPAADPDVRGSADDQFRQSERFVQSQIENIGGRLDQLHGDSDDAGTLAVRVSAVQPRLASALPLGDLHGQQGTASDNTMSAALSPIGSTQPAATMANGAAAASAAGTVMQEAPRWHVWAGGNISFGKQQPNGFVETRFTSQGLTVGMDGRVSDNLKLGTAFGFAWDHSRVGSNGSNNDASNASLAFYGSWRAAPQFYIDGIVGLGYGNINTTRYSTTGGVFLDGKRRASQTFAAVIVTYEGHIGSIEFAPYLRADRIWVHLNPYSETGSITWALAFNAADENSFSGVAGARLRFPLGGSWRLIGKAEYRTRLSGDYTQLIGYADLQGVQGSPYAITGTGVDSSTFTGGIGLEGRLRQATIRLNYDLSTMAGGNISNRFSGALIVPF